MQILIDDQHLPIKCFISFFIKGSDGENIYGCTNGMKRIGESRPKSYQHHQYIVQYIVNGM
jgi:hypothetical protein